VSAPRATLLSVFPTDFPLFRKGLRLTTKIEFYDRLREHIPEPAARLIAEEMRLDAELATKADLALAVAATKADLALAVAATKADLTIAVAHTDASIERLRSSLFRWTLTFFVPLWIGVYATLIAILLKGQ